MARMLPLAALPLIMAVLLAAADNTGDVNQLTSNNAEANATSSPPSSSTDEKTTAAPSSSSNNGNNNTDVSQVTLNTAESNAPPSSLTDEKTKATPSSSSNDGNNNNNNKGFYKGMSREFVDEHNKVRSRYNAKPVMWDKTLALYARRWANMIKGDCDAARHSPKNIYGECFFLGTNGTAKDALCSWEKEEFIYDRGTLGCTSGHDFKDCGHFAIMVKTEWRWVGCGRAPCTHGPRQGQFFISCSYSTDKPNATAFASTP